MLNTLRKAGLAIAASLLALPILTTPISAQAPATGARGDLDGPGWTGLTRPDDVVLARQSLMAAIDTMMRPIDQFTVDPDMDRAMLTENAFQIASMLKATPHLFPPTTNTYAPGADYPATIAMPAVWENFDAFTAMAESAENAALTLGRARDDDARRTAAVNLRATCDGCHAVYMEPYQPAIPSSDDADFDFDAIFE